MRSKKRISMREIARLCNLSHTTVSRILNGTGTFSEETRRLVLNTMLREGYSIEGTALAQQEKAAPMIGCLVADFTNEVFSDRLAEIGRYFQKKGVSVCVFETRRDPDTEVDLAQRLHHMGAAGIIMISPARRIEADLLPIPLLYMDHTVDEQTDPNAYCVSSDDYVGGRLAAQELLRKGCTKPLILNIRYVPYWLNQRIQGFIKGFEEHGIPIPTENILQTELNKSSFDSAKDLITYHWIKGTEFDCVFGASDWRAYGAMVALRSMGVQVPEEVKIVGYDGIRVSRYCETPITTIQQNSAMMSQVACDMMWKLINGEPVEKKQEVVPIRLQEGKTT